jgi:hypothetical protein
MVFQRAMAQGSSVLTWMWLTFFATWEARVAGIALWRPVLDRRFRHRHLGRSVLNALPELAWRI